MARASDLTTRLRAWSYRRQILASRAPGPLEALRGVIAVYSSHPMAPLALQARSALLDADGFVALEQERQAIRIPAMRGSIFLVADTAARIFAATRVPVASREKNLAYAGIDLRGYDQLKPRLLELAREPVDPQRRWNRW